MLLALRYLPSEPIQWDVSSETELILMSDVDNGTCIEPQILIKMLLCSLSCLLPNTGDFMI